MANGDHHWWDSMLRFGEGAIAAVASAAAGLMFWALRRLKTDRAIFTDDHKYVKALKKKRALTLIGEHAQSIEKFDERLEKATHLIDQLEDQIRSVGGVANSLQATVSTLTALVETRGKEHHDLRDMLQPIVMRLTLAERNIESLGK